VLGRKAAGDMVESNRYGEALFNLKVYQAFLYSKHQAPSKVEGYRKRRQGVVRRFKVERSVVHS
jgi:hypothetical protein